MIGDVDLDDFFPDEQLDSTMVGKSQNQMSRITFDKSKEYANKKYAQNKEGIHSGKLNYMFLEISKEVRRRIQPIGKWGVECKQPIFTNRPFQSSSMNEDRWEASMN